jgi:hypothetical protein
MRGHEPALDVGMAERKLAPFVIAGVFALGIAIVSSVLPDGSDERRAELAAIFNVPEDATWTAFDAATGRYGLRFTEAVITFTPEQWDAYVAKLDQPSAWDPSGRTFNGLELPDRVATGALTWHDAQWAWIVEEFACFWVNWGNLQTKEIDGKPDVWKTRSWRSFCWALIDDGEPRIVPCRGIKHTPKGLKLYARGMLDKDNRRLFAFIR